MLISIFFHLGYDNLCWQLCLLLLRDTRFLLLFFLLRFWTFFLFILVFVLSFALFLIRSIFIMFLWMRARWNILLFCLYRTFLILLLFLCFFLLLLWLLCIALLLWFFDFFLLIFSWLLVLLCFALWFHFLVRLLIILIFLLLSSIIIHWGFLILLFRWFLYLFLFGFFGFLCLFLDLDVITLNRPINFTLFIFIFVFHLLVGFFLALLFGYRRLFIFFWFLSFHLFLGLFNIFRLLLFCSSCTFTFLRFLGFLCYFLFRFLNHSILFINLNRLFWVFDCCFGLTWLLFILANWLLRFHWLLLFILFGLGGISLLWWFFLGFLTLFLLMCLYIGHLDFRFLVSNFFMLFFMVSLSLWCILFMDIFWLCIDSLWCRNLDWRILLCVLLIVEEAYTSTDEESKESPNNSFHIQC